MFKTHRDENMELMKRLASEIAAPVERFATVEGDLSKAGPIASQFFQQPEVNVQHLSDAELIETMAGAEHAARWKFREAMHAQYPTHPEMWDLDPPSVTQREFQGGLFWPVSSSKAATGTLNKSQTDATVTELYRRAAKKGMNLGALGAETKELLRSMVEQGRIRLVEEPGRLSISTV